MLQKFKQSKGSTATTAVLLAASAFTVGAVYFHNKRIEELERKVEHLINDSLK